MNGKNVLLKLNGKKLPISILIAGIVAVSTLQAQVKDNSEEVNRLRELPQQVATIEADVTNIKDDINDIRLSQRTTEQDIKLILREVRK